MRKGWGTFIAALAFLMFATPVFAAGKIIIANISRCSLRVWIDGSYIIRLTPAGEVGDTYEQYIAPGKHIYDFKPEGDSCTDVKMLTDEVVIEDGYIYRTNVRLKPTEEVKK